MRNVRPCIAALAALVALTGGVRAQAGERGTDAYLSFESWRTLAVAGGRDNDLDVVEPARSATSSRWRPSTVALDPLAEKLAASLAKEPPPVARETLDGAGEGLQRFHGLPGGIVLGLGARVPVELDGARFELRDGKQPALRLADGRVLSLPALAPETLRACVRFVGERLDGLVDLDADHRTAPRLAPAFAGGALEGLLLDMDRLPHRALPATRAWKSVIVDRDVRVLVCEGELVLAADLEVRFYDDARGSGWAERVLTVGASGTDLVGPRVTFDLGDELAPLAEIAAWLGFLRWLERFDPAGFALLRAR